MDSKDNTVFDEVTKMLIRPRRDTYHPDRLGPKQLIVKGKSQKLKNDRSMKQYIQVLRKDTVVQCKKQKIQLSYFYTCDRPDNQQKNTNVSTSQMIVKSKCVVYLHANSGSRLEGLQLVKNVLPCGWNLAVFDYRGSGISQGDYCSAGYHESDDLECILAYLAENEQVGQFSLWGRSMGAVTILYYLTKQYQGQYLQTPIKAVVLDSPFSNLQKLMYEVASSTVYLPQFVFQPLVSSISAKLQQKLGGVDILKELNLIERIKQIKEKNHQLCQLINRIEALFLTSIQDKLVKCSHVELLHKQYPFEHKQLYYYNGQHNDPRSDAVKFKCANLLCSESEKNNIKLGGNKKVDKNSNYYASRRSDMMGVIGKMQQNEDIASKDTQFLLPPAKKSQILSPKMGKGRPSFEPGTPKLQQKGMVDRGSHQIQLQGPRSPQYQDSRPSRIQKPLQPPLFDRSQTSIPSPTIIINHNYNVSVNVYDKNRSIQVIGSEPIPPINFNNHQRQLSGNLTQRTSESLNNNKNYFIPYTSKVERRTTQENVINHWNSNVSSSNNSTAGDNQSLSSSFTYGKAGNSVLNQQGYKPPQHSSSQQLPSPYIDIPHIDFNNMHPGPSQERGQYGFRRENNNLEPMKSQQEFKSVSIIGSPQNCKDKLSLAEAKRIQKEDNQRSIMKSSKLLYSKDRLQREEDSHKLNIKRQSGNAQVDDSWKYKSQQCDRNKMRSMKTSLMAKKKPTTGDRKNSDSVNGNIKGSLIAKKFGEDNKPFGGILGHMGQSVNSPKYEQNH